MLRYFSFRRPSSPPHRPPPPSSSVSHLLLQCSNMATAVAQSDNIQVAAQEGEQGPAANTTLAASAAPSRSTNTAADAKGTLSRLKRGAARTLSVLSVIPPEAFINLANALKFMSEVIEPVPWLGPAAGLIASIIEHCQRVGKNKHAASELALHCLKMLDAIREIFSESKENTVKNMLGELTNLLKRIKRMMEEWERLSFFKSLLNQETIDHGIKTFHVEIAQFCQRYTIVTQALSFNWMEAHEKWTKEDMAEIRSFFAAAENRQVLEHASISEIRDDVTEILRFMQRLSFDSEWKHAQRIALRDNFAAMCRSTGKIPPDIELHEDFLEREEFPILGNGAFDIYRGSCAGYTCAIKVLRRMAYDDNTERRFQRQFRLWRDVYAKDRGKHILPLIGAIYRVDPPNPSLCFVSPWMKNGDALHFVRNHESVDRIKLIVHIAEGLKVLHTFEPPLLHGYLKCSNILINDFGEPLLADFGLMRIMEEKFNVNSLPEPVNAYRWLPPEMIYGGDLTDKSDIFMFGMTVLEIMTEQKPFSHIRRDPQVLGFRQQGGRPLKPQGEATVTLRERGLDDRLWALLERCWPEKPEKRPTIIEVLEVLQSLRR